MTVRVANKEAGEIARSRYHTGGQRLIRPLRIRGLQVTDPVCIGLCVVFGLSAFARFTISTNCGSFPENLPQANVTQGNALRGGTLNSEATSPPRQFSQQTVNAMCRIPLPNKECKTLPFPGPFGIRHSRAAGELADPLRFAKTARPGGKFCIVFSGRKIRSR